MEHKMFCYQCQETAGCSGCTQMGVCGKKPEVAAMQDLLVYVSKGLSAVTTQLRKEGTKVSEETNHLITWNLFTTITNANFDNEAIIARIHNTLSVRRTLILQVKDTSGLPEAAFWDIKTNDGSDASDDVLFAKAKEAGAFLHRHFSCWRLSAKYLPSCNLLCLSFFFMIFTGKKMWHILYARCYGAWWVF